MNNIFCMEMSYSGRTCQQAPLSQILMLSDQLYNRVHLSTGISWDGFIFQHQFTSQLRVPCWTQSLNLASYSCGTTSFHSDSHGVRLTNHVMECMVIWVWFQYSSECNLTYLIVAISHYWLMCSIDYFEGFVCSVVAML